MKKKRMKNQNSRLLAVSEKLKAFLNPANIDCPNSRIKLFIPHPFACVCPAASINSPLPPHCNSNKTNFWKSNNYFDNQLPNHRKKPEKLKVDK